MQGLLTSSLYSLGRTRCVNVAFMDVRGQMAALIVFIASLCVGCANTSEGPGLAAADFLHALQQQDTEAVYASLDSSAVDKMKQVHGTVSALQAHAEEHYSADAQKTIMKSAGLSRWPQSELDLLTPWMEQASQLPPMTALQRWGAGVSKVEVSGDQAIASTWGGDVIHLRKDEAGWRVVLSDDNAQHLESMGLRVNGVKTKIDAAIRGLNYAHRYGGSQ